MATDLREDGLGYPLGLAVNSHNSKEEKRDNAHHWRGTDRVSHRSLARSLGRQGRHA